MLKVIPLIPVELTPDVAVKLRFMMEAGVFDMRGGSATLNFSKLGELTSIKKEIYTYAQTYSQPSGDSDA